MKMLRIAWFLSTLAGIGLVSASIPVEVLFDSGVYLIPVDPSDLPEATATQIEDPKDTGSYVFDADFEETGDKRISLNFFARDFRSSSIQYFRAHPLFISCIQRIRSDLQQQQKKLVIIERGFQTAVDVKGSSAPQDLYARSGAGATLAFKDGTSTGGVLQIAGAAMKNCPALFATAQRDIGLIITAQSVHIHMTGAQDNQPLYATDGYPGMTDDQFKNWCLDRIDEAIDPPKSPDCGAFSGLANGGVFPSGATHPAMAVGDLDTKVTRETEEDFKRLMQFPGRTVIFENSEGTAGWCGKQGNPCVDCSNGIKGSALNSRCADRTMTPRLYATIQILQKLVREQISGGKLKVLEAWDEAYDGKANGDSTDPRSLHYEARAAKLQVSTSNTSATRKTLTKLAICSGADFVKHNADHVFIAVRKQAQLEPFVTDFPEHQLLAVQPPSGKFGDYELPATYSEAESLQYPLFDSNNQANVVLSEYTKVSTFQSRDPEFRYFRLRPLLVECFDAIQFQENKQGNVQEIKVVRGFLSNREQANYLDALMDPRYNTHTRGVAMELTYPDTADKSTYTIHRLAKLAIDKCTTLFHQQELAIGLGLYNKSVFVDMRSSLNIWVDNDGLVPSNKNTTAEYIEELTDRYRKALKNRLVDPDNEKEACANADVPQKQSPNYRHKHIADVLRQRREAPDPEDCKPTSDTPFCTATKTHRDTEVAHVWREVLRKHLYHNKKEVEDALKGCLGACGKCSKGKVYEDKVENCENFLHWVSFDLMNEDPDVTNFYPRGKLALKAHACRRTDQRHCLDKTPLFLLLAPSIHSRYRPDPTKSVQEELYTKSANPLPALQVMSRIYAMHASGLVRFWVEDEADLASLRSSLQTVMLYNKNVSKVVIYIPDASRKSEIESYMEKVILEWSKSGCPKYTREAVTPYEILPMPKEISKRDLEMDLGDSLRLESQNWENRWLERSFS